MIRLPGVCIVCRRPVVWTGKRWRDAPLRRGGGGRHVCPQERPRCGRWMPNARERCARRPGHKPWCRTAYAMENERLAKTGRAA